MKKDVSTEEEEESRGCKSECFSMEQLSVPSGIGSFLNSLADDICNGGDSFDDDDNIEGDVWQRAVPSG